MSIIAQTIGLFSSFFTADNYYRSLNSALRRFNDEYTMLHYPLFKKQDDTFFQSQKNLTDHCLELLGKLEGKKVLEVGCGNGVQACYISESYNPLEITGIDINPASIEIALGEKTRRELKNIWFHVDDAQKMKNIRSQSVDVVISIESAFHYPDKSAFLKEIHRVLQPGGRFLIADLLTLKKKGYGLRLKWKKLQNLNHWNMDKYKDEFNRANLQIQQTDDITDAVVRGFRSYPLWFKQMRKKGVLNDFIFKMFYYVILQWYIFLLSQRRKYVVFAGNKAMIPVMVQS